MPLAHALGVQRCGVLPALQARRSSHALLLRGTIVGKQAPRWHRISTRDTIVGITATNGTSDTEAADSATAAAASQQQAEAAAIVEESGSEAEGSAPAAAAAAAGPKSHPLSLPEDPFGAEELVKELTDTSSFGKRGEGYTAVQALATLFVIFPPFRLAGLFDLMATLALTAGLVFCVYALVSLGRYISPLPAPRKVHKLVTDGLYSYVRHPLYGGLVLAAFGLAAITRSEGRLALAMVLWAVLERKIVFEESCLVQRYGAEYESYRDRTKKFVPFVY